MDTNGQEIILQEKDKQSTITDQTIENKIEKIEDEKESESSSDSSSSEEDSDESVASEPQTILDKAGCTTQLSNLHLNPDGTVPLELMVECVHCLLSDKLWPALILCKAISVLEPGHEIAVNLQQVIIERIEQKTQESNDDSESSESDSSDSTSNSDSDSDSSDTQDDSATKDITEKVQKKDAKHSCLACTN